jgi:co-chaperonin GroES (HSP10)
MRAIGKNIIINKIDEEITTDSGLLLSNEDVKDFRYQKGKILMPGSEVSEHITTDKVVYYDSRQACTLVLNGETVTIIQERDVVVVL